jgi:hypothetical protein
MIEKALVDYLGSIPEITALISEDGDVRIFPLIIPQKRIKAQMPCIVYSLTNESRSKTYCGTTGTIEVTIGIDCYAPKLSVARNLNVQLRRALLDYRGAMGDALVKDVTLNSSMSLADTEPGLMRVADIYSIWYRERSV